MSDEKTNESFPTFDNVDDEKFFYTRMSVQRDQINEIKRHLKIFADTNDDSATIEHFVIARFEHELSEEQFVAFNTLAFDAKSSLPGIIKIQLSRIPAPNNLYEGSNSVQKTKNFSISLIVEFDSAESLKYYYNSEFRAQLMQSCAPFLGESGQVISFDLEKDDYEEEDDFAFYQQVQLLKVNSNATDSDLRNLIFDIIAMKIETPGLFSFSLRKAPQEGQFYDGYNAHLNTSDYGIIIFFNFISPEALKSFHDANTFQKVLEPYRALMEGLENDIIAIDLSTF